MKDIPNNPKAGDNVDPARSKNGDPDGNCGPVDTIPIPGAIPHVVKVPRSVAAATLRLMREVRALPHIRGGHAITKIPQLAAEADRIVLLCEQLFGPRWCAALEVTRG